MANEVVLFIDLKKRGQEPKCLGMITITEDVWDYLLGNEGKVRLERVYDQNGKRLEGHMVLVSRTI